MPAVIAEPVRRAGYGQLFAVSEFRALYVARTLSLLGDQLARVALAVLVFRETNSAFMTALVYALTFLPYIGQQVQTIAPSDGCTRVGSGRNPVFRR